MVSGRYRWVRGLSGSLNDRFYKPLTMSKRFRPLHDLPLFAREEDIASALMGSGNLSQWRQIASLLEGDGFPKIDHVMGGRYTPAIRKFFDREYRIDANYNVGARDGPEALGTYKRNGVRKK
jgi:hypothetical protein